MFSNLFSGVRQGWAAAVSPDVANVLGRPQITLEQSKITRLFGGKPNTDTKCAGLLTTEARRTRRRPEVISVSQW